MKTDDIISVEELRKLLRLDEHTGKLYWRPRSLEAFDHLPPRLRLRQCARWNAMFADQEAFTANHKGYRRSRLAGRNCYAHHVVWALVHGRWPDQIDHDNQDRADNRPGNLIERSQAANMKNQPMRSNNRSGVNGVHWSEREQRWKAAIGHGNEKLHLGTFESFQDAVAARRKAEREYGYHANHGRPA